MTLELNDVIVLGEKTVGRLQYLHLNRILLMSEREQYALWRSKIAHYTKQKRKTNSRITRAKKHCEIGSTQSIKTRSHNHKHISHLIIILPTAGKKTKWPLHYLHFVKEVGETFFYLVLPCVLNFEYVSRECSTFPASLVHKREKVN